MNRTVRDRALLATGCGLLLAGGAALLFWWQSATAPPPEPAAEVPVADLRPLLPVTQQGHLLVEPTPPAPSKYLDLPPVFVPNLRFEPALLVQAGVAPEVANAVVVAAAAHYRHWREAKLARVDGPEVQAGDVFFAVWPELGSLLLDQRIALRARPQQKPALGEGSVYYGADAARRRITFVFDTPGQRVQLQLNESVLPKAEMQRLMATLAAGADGEAGK